MSARRGAVLGAALGLTSLGFAGAVQAAGGCGCTVPSGHQVTVPGVNINAPSVSVNSPTIVVETGAVNVQTSASASAQASASANASTSASSSSNAVTNAQANALAQGAIYNAGGGSSWYTSDSPAGYIPNLQVEGGESAEARRICTEMRSVQAQVAVQAVCLDDKEIPHPASQVMPERDVPSGYAGEIYRCIAGARMQYTIADFHGQADFGHGQTVTCQKGEALYYSAASGLACRPQRPARDCNERSLLRRFGAGIKVLALARAQQCVAYRTETAKAAGGNMELDGGVGGVVH